MAETQPHEIATARDALRNVLPRWCREGRLGKLVYALMQPLDAIIDATVISMHTRMPGLNGYQSLALTGKDRKIRRGLTESDITYAARQLRWLDDHKFRGNAIAMLTQLFAYWNVAGVAPRIELINASGGRYIMATDGTITRDVVTWTPPVDLPGGEFAHWWLFFFLADPPDGDGLWGSPGQWGDGGLWGVDMTKEEIDRYRVIATEWNCGYTIGHIVILDEAEAWNTYAPGEWPVQIGV